MNTNILNGIIRGLLDCGYLDFEFLAKIIYEQSLDFENILESIEMNFGKEHKYDFNYIMHETLSTIAWNFIEKNEELFYDECDKDFEVFTNYLDSHIRFNNEEIQEEFEKYYYR